LQIRIYASVLRIQRRSGLDATPMASLIAESMID